jgi:hypothetical protein
VVKGRWFWHTSGLSMNAPEQVQPASQPPESAEQAKPPAAPDQPREIGGRDGPEPTRFGDWEKAGRCIDF